jgi:UDP-N-acetyl-D-mannosaminuronic acid transferase (WecB/TagA/CpsF family)
MFGIGAAFNFYLGEVTMPKFSFFGLRFIWLNRLIYEPQKLLKRILPYLVLLPKLLYF